METTAKQALIKAKAASGKTNREISEASGVSAAQIERYFKEHDAYYPGLSVLPDLCQALGNVTILQWAADQTGYRLVRKDAVPDHPDTREEMLDDSARITALQKAIRDNLGLIVVREMANAAHEDIEQTVEQYRREHGL